MPLTAQALVEGDAAFTDRLGTPVASGWFVFQEARLVLVATASRGEADERGLHVFFDDDGALVGNGGGRGLPSTASPSSGTRSHPLVEAGASPLPWFVNSSPVRGSPA